MSGKYVRERANLANIVNRQCGVATSDQNVILVPVHRHASVCSCVMSFLGVSMLRAAQTWHTHTHRRRHARTHAHTHTHTHTHTRTHTHTHTHTHTCTHTHTPVGTDVRDVVTVLVLKS
jgi:ABC-type nickel/cobalt efflux system permease component RcnA